MKLVQAMVRGVFALGASACAVNTDESDGDSERVGEAKQATTYVGYGDYFPGCVTVDWADYGGSQWYDDVEIDESQGYTFTGTFQADFDDWVLDSWTTGNVDACQANEVYLDVESEESGSWVSLGSGYYHPTATRVGNQIGTCRATITLLATTNPGTAFSAFMNGIGSDGVYPVESITLCSTN